MTTEEWNKRIDIYIEEENRRRGETLPDYHIFDSRAQREGARGVGLYNSEVTRDMIGRFARALGDPNPLYSDPVYAADSCMGGIIAPPVFECCIVSPYVKHTFPRLRNMQMLEGGIRWERFAPIRPGDSFRAEVTDLGLTEISKPDRPYRLLLRKDEIRLIGEDGCPVSRLTHSTLLRLMAPGTSEIKSSGTGQASQVSQTSQVSQIPQTSQASQTSQIPQISQAAQTSQIFQTSHASASGPAAADTRAHSAGSRPAQPAAASTPASQKILYTDGQLTPLYDNLSAQLEGRLIRGCRPRLWEETMVGELLPEVMAGPYDVSDAVAFMSAMGQANAFATKWNAIRAQGTRAPLDPGTGTPRLPMDWHYSNELARQLGQPDALIPGLHLQALAGYQVGSWMGDAGRLISLDLRNVKTAYYGDILTQTGCVTDKYTENGQGLVRIALKGLRQDGTVHTEGEAIVALP